MSVHAGYAAEAEAGVLGASGANATSGRYTGIDHNGVYADVSASGSIVAGWDIRQLRSRELGPRFARKLRDGRPRAMRRSGQLRRPANRLYDTGETRFEAADQSRAALRMGAGGLTAGGMVPSTPALPLWISDRIGERSRCSLVLRDSQLDGVRRVSAPGTWARSHGREFDTGRTAASIVRY